MSLTRMLSTACALSALSLGGCASLSSGEPNETMTFTSLPSGASITVVDVTGLPGYVDINHRGSPVYTGTTPVTLDLQGVSDNREHLQRYVVVVERNGYERYETRLEATGTDGHVRTENEHGVPTAAFTGWRLADPRTRDISYLPYNHIDVELRDLND